MVEEYKKSHLCPSLKVWHFFFPFLRLRDHSEVTIQNRILAALDCEFDPDVFLDDFNDCQSIAGPTGTTIHINARLLNRHFV